jgi:hypothetical protein
LQGGNQFMTEEERPGLKKMEHLKRSLEEAEIIKTGMKLVLMNPSLNPECKGEYKKVFSKLNDEIREMKIMMDRAQKMTHSSKSSDYET